MIAKLIDVSFSAIENTALITLKTNDNHSVRELVEMVNKLNQSGKELLTVDIKPYKSKRSLGQNEVMWGLLDLLSQHIHGRKDQTLVWETYIEMLERTGQKYDYFWVLPEAAQRLKESFRTWKLIEDNGKMQMYKCYYGSSHFNTKEMFDFIESIKSELIELGVNYARVLHMPHN